MFVRDVIDQEGQVDVSCRSYRLFGAEKRGCERKCDDLDALFLDNLNGQDTVKAAGKK